jgi:hypothetical protein
MIATAQEGLYLNRVKAVAIETIVHDPLTFPDGTPVLPGQWSMQQLQRGEVGPRSRSDGSDLYGIRQSENGPENSVCALLLGLREYVAVHCQDGYSGIRLSPYEQLW